MNTNKQKMFKNKKAYIVSIFIFIFFVLGVKVFAADSKFYFSAPVGAMSPNSEFSVSVYLDSVNLTNALDLEVVYPKDKLKFLTYNNARSVVDLWQTNPKVLSNGNIGFSGGMLKGWSGKRGMVMNLSFSALNTGEAKISFAKQDIYLADGKGTKISADGSFSNISIAENAKQVTIEIPKVDEDKTPPDLVMRIVENPNDKTTLIVFKATDPESGIKQTQIRFKKWWLYGEWFSAINPVIYPSGVWQLELKTTNNVGVENIKFYSAPSKIIYKLIFMLFGVIFVVYVLKQVYNKRGQKI